MMSKLKVELTVGVPWNNLFVVFSYARNMIFMICLREIEKKVSLSFEFKEISSVSLSIISSRSKACKGIQVAAVSFPPSSPTAMFLSSVTLARNSAKTRPSRLIH